MEVSYQGHTLLPGDPRLIEHLVGELKNQGIFDQFRKECIADVDTKPAYQNLRQRVEGSVNGFLKSQVWTPDTNKNQLREMLRKNIYESGFLETGVERIVDQVVNPKISTVFLPQVEEVVYKFLGIDKPPCNNVKNGSLTINTVDLLPTDLDPISPDSEVLDKSLNKSSETEKLDDSKAEDEESPPFEPIDDKTALSQHDESSNDSHLSGISGLTSHDSNHSGTSPNKTYYNIPEVSNQDSQLSKVSSSSHLSIITTEDKLSSEKMDISDDTQNSKNGDWSNSKISVSGHNLGAENGCASNFNISEQVNVVVTENVDMSTNQGYVDKDTTEVEMDVSDSQDKFDFTQSFEQKIEEISSNLEELNRSEDKSEVKMDSKDSNGEILETSDNDIFKEFKTDSNGDITLNDEPKESKEIKVDLKDGSFSKDDSKDSKSDSKDSKPENKSDSKDKPSSKEVRTDSKESKSAKSDSKESRSRSDSERHRSRHSESKDRKRSDDKKSDRRDKDRTHSSSSKDKNRDKSKDSKSQDSKSKDEKRDDKDKKSSSSSSKHSSRDKDRSKSSSSSSRDKDRSESRSKSKQDTRKSDDSKKTEDLKKSSDSKKSTDSKKDDKDSKKDDKDSKKDDRDSKKDDRDSKSSSDKHKSSSRSSKDNTKDRDRKSSSSSSRKDSKESKKPKDDHSSSKDKKNSRRSADRDSNDGASGNKPASNGKTCASSSNSKGSETSFSGSNSGDGGQSDKPDNTEKIDEAVDDEQATILLPITNNQVKIKKPRFASNIFEVRKLIKIRKKMEKMEKRRQLAQLEMDARAASDVANDVNEKKVEEISQIVAENQVVAQEEIQETIENKEIPKELKEEESEVIDIKEEELVLPKLQTSVISKASWDAIEAQMMNVDYNSYGDSYGDNAADSCSSTKSSENADVTEVVADSEIPQRKSTDEEDCLYFNPQISPTVTRFLQRVEDIKKSTDAMEHLIESKDAMGPPSSGRRSRKPNLKYSSFDYDTEFPVNEIPIDVINKVDKKKKGVKRKTEETVDGIFNENNNKKMHVLEDVSNVENEAGNVDQQTSTTNSTKCMSSKIKTVNKAKKMKKTEAASESYAMPLSPVSDISSNSIESSKSNMRKSSEERERDALVQQLTQPRQTRGNLAASQRYSSDDLYKPRPLFTGSRRSRGIVNNADKSEETTSKRR